MAGEAKAKDDAAERRAKSVLKSLKDLEPELLEDLSIGAETELAQREAVEKGNWTNIQDIADDINEASKLWGKVSGISTGYPSLDAKIGGLKAGELILIGGDTNNGKSALAQNIAVNVSHAYKVAFITLEMLKTEAGSRLKHMNKGTLEGMDVDFQTEYQIDYRHLRPLFENAVANGAALVILDYLQYLGRGMTLDEVAKMTKLMKSLALEFQLPFLVIVSLRKSDSGKFKRKWTEIETEDLMGTSAIAYDADIALVASRRNLENEFESDKFFVKVIKARNMDLNYDDRFLAFNWDKTRITEAPDYDWLPTDDEIKDEEEVPKPPVQGALPYKD
jgi:replicative DNA helicase